MEKQKEYTCSAKWRCYCAFEGIGGRCNNPYACTNKVVAKSNAHGLALLLEKYSEKLTAHMFYESENPEQMSSNEFVLYDLHTSVLKEIISDLEKIVKLP